MLPALVSLKGLIRPKSYHIDHPFFRLHYQATVGLLLAFCLILTAKVMFGDTIDCQSRILTKSDYYDNMCYAIGTYTRYRVMRNHDEAEQSTMNITIKVDPISKYLYSGVLIGHYPEEHKVKKYWHNYYQYMPVILFVQAMLFYLPHYLWKMWENGTISSICKRLHENRFTPADYIETNNDILFYLQNCFKLNKSLVYKYYLCHVLLLINLFIQVITLDVIFNHQFIFYGALVTRYYFYGEHVYGLQSHSDSSLDNYQLNNPMDFVFPKITSCKVDLASMSGPNPDDARFMCILPLNILHDKFYLLLWYWFVILGALTIVQLIYDLLFVMLPFFRKYIFQRRYGGRRYTSSLHTLFILDLIGSNTDKFAFTVLLRELLERTL